MDTNQKCKNLFNLQIFIFLEKMFNISDELNLSDKLNFSDAFNFEEFNLTNCGGIPDLESIEVNLGNFFSISLIYTQNSRQKSFFLNKKTCFFATNANLFIPISLQT